MSTITPPHVLMQLSTKNSLRRYKVLIFLTGAVTLTLEVLASRIMTPYFGVSLYIWAGILSITLVFLALGYQLGGHLSRCCTATGLHSMFLGAPLLAAGAILTAAALYPVVFPVLARQNLIFASFLGGFLLLAAPLVVLSAMNPLLIALARQASLGGDAGAGRVLFLSTLGSVAGVLLTAFVLIPQMTNFRALLLVGLGLCGAASFLALVAHDLAFPQRRRLFIAGMTLFLMSIMLLIGKDFYFRALPAWRASSQKYQVLAEYPSVFGNLKVVASSTDSPESPPLLLYLQDGVVQNATTFSGEPQDHTNVILRLLGDYAPSARCAMVLGLGAGVIPRLLAQQGVGVTVVEINPASIRAATDFFHFDPKQVNLRVEDARTAVRRFPQTFEVVVADLFQGDGTPEYLLSREFFLELQRSLQPEGLLVMNLFYDPLQEEVNQRLLATVASVFPCILELRTPAEGREVQNLYLVLANRPLDPLLARRSADAGHPGLSSEDILTLKSIRHIERGSLIHFTPVTDEHNLFPLIWAGTYVRFRRQCINLPPALLVN